MKSFFESALLSESSLSGEASERSGESSSAPSGLRQWGARIAIYDSPMAAPRTVDVGRGSQAELIEQIAVEVYTAARDLGGEIPFTVIREVSENFIHAEFREPVVSILDRGRAIRFADQGPGIPDKERAVLPGFTTASSAHKDVIRGVGSGLPIVKEYLGHTGGQLEIDDNLGTGTVITLRVAPPASAISPDAAPAGVAPGSPPVEQGGVSAHPAIPLPPLTTRQKQVLSLVLEIGEAGPTAVSKELSMALSTAYRDLAFLEQAGLICSDESGKRMLTPEGASYLDGLFS